MVLIVAEKPSVARDIARVLGANQKEEGCYCNQTYRVTWALGHLVQLCAPEDYHSNLKKWSRETLPIIPTAIQLKPIGKTRKQLSLLKKYMNDRQTDEIVCATDSGREGELIFRYIYTYTKCKKPVKRLWISSLTDESISEGFSQLKDSSHFDSLFTSAKCRSEADWLVGINASRAYSIRYGALLSIGRVQTPTLAMLVNRQHEINNFVPKNYWEVEGDFGNYQGIWHGQDGNAKLETEQEALAICGKVSEKDGTVIRVEIREKKELPPLLYDLTALQRACNTTFGYSAKKTLDIAQALYEKRKIITYPRTDSNYLTEDMKSHVHTVMKKLLQTEYQEFVTPIQDSLHFHKRIVNNQKVTDHHAIIPTKNLQAYKSLQGDEKNVFDLIVKRFLAVFYPPYLYRATKVTTQVEGEDFLSRGRQVTSLGWMCFYPGQVKEKELPPLKKGQSVFLEKATALAKQTKPPQHYTESTLLQAMEHAGRFVEDEALKEQLKESGIGTPATRAAIIERLLAVGYIQRKKKSLVPTEKGMNLIQVVPPELKSPETTGRWEKGLLSIQKGKMTEQKFMGSIKRYVQFLVEASDKQESSVVFEPEKKKKTAKAKYLGDCPQCGKGKVLSNTKAFYCNRWKEGCQFTLWKNNLEEYGIKMTDTLIRTLLKEKETPVKMALRQTGEAGQALLTLNENYQLQLKNFNREAQ